MAAPLVAPPSPLSAAARAELRWVSRSSCPPDWPELLERCGGGYFHSPIGLLAGSPAGPPMFAQLLWRNRPVGVAVGVRHSCSFSLHPRHIYFPSLPAVAPSQLRDAALEALADELKEQGAVDTTFDSFDAGWRPSDQDADGALRRRIEHVVVLEDSEEAQLARCHKHHRRYATRGARMNWTLGLLGADEARAALAEVQRHASDRASDRGQSFIAEPPAVAGIAATRLTDPWGATVFGAWDGEALLSAALVGWANRRAYYISGGSTPTGYEARAAIWMHLKIMAALAAAGVRSYNLGGTAAAAADEPDDPEHGLHEFKLAFGADVVPCRGQRRTLQPAHTMAHRIVANIVGGA